MKTALCMPVGPAGIKAETAQFMCSLLLKGIVHELYLATGHLLRARNTAWQGALASDAERVLWLDADVFTDAASCEGFIDRAEQRFNRFPLALPTAWYGATCMRRGPGKLVNFAREDNHWRAGLGLVYWHVPRMRQALALVGVDAPFRWVEPLGEDYRLCDDIHAAGFDVAIDIECPTMHIDVGMWPGSLIAEEAERLASEMRDAESEVLASGAV